MAKKNRISMKQIAECLKLSQGTVSIVLNGHGKEMRISAETEKLIMDKAKELGYPLDNIRKKRQTVGELGNPVITIFVPQLADESLSPIGRMLAGINQAMRQMEVPAEILICPFEYDNLVKRYQYLSQNFCSGAIIVALSEKDLEGLLAQEFHIPIVIYNHVNEKYASVYVDDYRGGYRVAELFAERGHKKVGILMPDNRNKAMRLRVAGYLDGCRNMGLEVNSNHVLECRISHSGAADVVREMIEQGELPDAFFVTQDDLALGMLKVLKFARVEVPTRMEIMSYGDNGWGSLVSPSLSSIRLPIEEMCATCFQMVWNMIHTGDWSPISRIHTLEFVFRESCGGHLN